MDAEKIKKAVSLFLEGIGEDPGRPGLRETPERVARMCAEIFSGLKTPSEGLLKPIEGESHDEMALLKD
ncbi:MAG: GTP cyclohydrolase I, partial [Nitrospiraceae bacterium]|nr:GTP cyclohydrolase I [Nitrospiraceae bacterium]